MARAMLQHLLGHLQYPGSFRLETPLKGGVSPVVESNLLAGA